jgi:Zn-dependent peptidase ImmA (M78 family)
VHLFERGYKNWCEKYAISKRLELGFKPSDPLDPHLLAKNLGVAVKTPNDVPGLSVGTKAILLRNDGKTPSCWSAVTLVVREKVVVILNSSHSKPRQASDLMHELSHRIRGHQPHEMEISSEGMMFVPSYDKLEELEADWLSACLLLPRPALVFIKTKRITDEAVAEQYAASKKILGYRMASTGVSRQFA